MKIDESAFIRDLIEKEGMSDCNSVNILIKSGHFINIPEVDIYKKTDLKTYQQLIKKLIYLSYETRFDITFIVC